MLWAHRSQTGTEIQLGEETNPRPGLLQWPMPTPCLAHAQQSLLLPRIISQPVANTGLVFLRNQPWALGPSLTREKTSLLFCCPPLMTFCCLPLGFVLRWATRNTSRVGTFPKLLAVCLNRCGALFCPHLTSSWCCRSCCSCGRQRNPSFVSLQQIHLQTLFWLLYCVFTFNLPVLFFNSSLGQAFSMQRPSPFLHSLLCPAI